MDTSGKIRRTRQGFTLVELLVVIVIIGILAGLITGAAIMARNTVKNAAVRAEIGQIDIALQRYKTEFGEYPPDFTGLNEDDNPAIDTPAEAAAKVVLNRHLRKRFPKFVGGWNQVVANLAQAPPLGYGINAAALDSASALAFWLGGLPEDPTLGNRPAGFHTDPTNPFKPGLPRTQPLFEFSDDEERYLYDTAGVLQCYYFPQGIREKPYVYFKSQRAPAGGHTYWFMHKNPADATQYVAMVRTWPPVIPSLAPGAVSERAVSCQDTATRWNAEEKYQIICSGLDDLFGTRQTPAPPVQYLPATPLPAPPVYNYPITTTGANFAEDENDNLTSFSDGKLEDGIE